VIDYEDTTLFLVRNKRGVCDMSNGKYEFLIVGSGAGGATLARELAVRGKSVLILERGRSEEKIGTYKYATRFYDSSNKLTNMPRKSREGVVLWRSFMAGGTTVVSCGNGVRCLEDELGVLGIDLEEEFSEAEKEMQISPIPDELLSEGSKRIRSAANELGYRMEPMPKFINAASCRKCGQCVFGCVDCAKWTALDYLKEATEKGAEILYEAMVDRVLIKNDKAEGVVVKQSKARKEISAEVIILAAGGLSTPVILQKSGFSDAGSGLFADLLVNTYGVTDGINQINEPVMALVNHDFYKEKGFILSPFINCSSKVRFVELGMKGMTVPVKKLLGIMTKTRDDASGRVYPDGFISKSVTENDWQRLNEGSAIAREILIKAGASSKSILVSRPQGAHPGGTAAIGKIVDSSLATEVKGLFVCDASVLPVAPGLPPILTIVALAKRLAKTLTTGA
jgi:choline dehydrogenase-like flavoprotein